MLSAYLFLSIAICVAFGLYVCSKSKWFLESTLGRYLFVTYYQFDFDNTAAIVKLQSSRGDALSAQETTAHFLANAQFGIVLKKLDNPRQLEFVPVALHQGALNEGSTQLPLISYANFVRRTVGSQDQFSDTIATTTTKATFTNMQAMEQKVIQMFIDRSIAELQQQQCVQFTQSFQKLFDVLLCDPSARITFHVFDMQHALELDRMLPKECKRKFFAAHFRHESDNPFYVAFDVKDDTTSTCPESSPLQSATTTFLNVLGGTINKPLSQLRYTSRDYRSQESIFTEQCDVGGIHIFREDKERFETMGKQTPWGKHGLAAFSFLTLFKVVRCVVFDDEQCWNLSVLHGKFVHVNPLCSTKSNWLESRATPQSVLTTFGFWNLVLCISAVYWVLAMLSGIWLIILYAVLLYAAIDDGRGQNRGNYVLLICLTQLPALAHIYFFINNFLLLLFVNVFFLSVPRQRLQIPCSSNNGSTCASNWLAIRANRV